MPSPYSWARVVHASTRLSGDQKILWEHIRLLDNGPDGCFLAPAKLAARVGLQERGLEKCRQALTKAGLVVSERRGKRVHWFVRLPEPCYPTQRPTEEEILGYARILDGFIGEPARGPDLGPPAELEPVTREQAMAQLRETLGVRRPA